MSKFCVDLITKSGKDVFYYVTSDKDLYRLFRQRMSDKENHLVGLRSVNGGKILIDCREIAAVMISLAEQQDDGITNSKCSEG